ncbi:unnamed protein product [Cercospora beticola]|nr:unnamed protein product [Cercospora beticola]
MVKAAVEALLNVKHWVKAARSRIVRMASGEGTPGTRLAPTQSGTNDTKIGGRLDFGDRFTKADGKEYRRLKFQLNKKADNKTVAELAGQDSHKVWAEADVPIGSDADADEVVEDVFDALETDLKKKL